MDYRLHHEGRDLGRATLEELRARRASGELSGQEMIWREGMEEWQKLDSVLGAIPLPPPLPLRPAASATAPPPQRSRFWIGVAVAIAIAAFLGLAVVVGVVAFVAIRTAKQQTPAVERTAEATPANATQPDATASIARTTNNLTEEVAKRRMKEFLQRQWLEGYKERGERNHPKDADGVAMITSWIESSYGQSSTNLPAAGALAETLSSTLGVQDPLLLTVAGMLTEDKQKKIERLERALKGYEDSAHLSYPRMAAAIGLVQASEFAQEQQPVIRTVLRSFYNCFKDESFRPEDQPEIAEILINGWAKEFYEGIPGAFASTARSIGPEFSWLANVLEGDSRINIAWRFRGSGFASTVTEEGWKNFREQIALARTNLVAAWTERPDLPIASAAMIRVSMAQDGGREMRLWFDRAIAAQIDYPSAWSNMRWGLRPRWHGNVETMLAFGKRAVETGRFDTDVPRIFMDVIADAESDLNLPAGDHIFGQPEIWPEVKKLYEGYIAEGPAEFRNGWRSAYSIVSFLAGHYDISRAQLEAINWQPRERNVHDWGRDLSLVALEVAARTGSLGSRVTEAENKADRDDAAGAFQIYEQIKDLPEADGRTRRFMDYRRRTLALEKSVQAGEWTSMLPESMNDPAWSSLAGRILQAGADGLEMESGPYGHMLRCRARVGSAFEIKGAFEVVKAPSAAFEAGVGFGKPDWREGYWYSFRATQDDSTKAGANFSKGWSIVTIRNQSAELKPGKNEFYFRFKNDYLSASINGREVMSNVEVAESAQLNLRHHTIALTGSTTAGTVLRYHSLQARRLPLP